ncbi:hypothetical protein PMAC_000032 [Pneumocystis sp. 'macacae']|nr:hypothetical protein PMAC_000032 [Pneumocystis sp. 'macacae']
MKRGITSTDDCNSVFMQNADKDGPGGSYCSDFSLNKLKKLEFYENESLDEKTKQKRIICNLPTKCMHNPSTFFSFSAYETHYQQQHCNVCYKCEKVFPSLRILELHISEVHDPIVSLKKERGEQIFACFIEKCQERFHNTRERRKHLVQNHFYPKEYHFNVIYTGISSKDTSLLFSKKNTKKKNKKYQQQAIITSEISSGDSLMNELVDKMESTRLVPLKVHFGNPLLDIQVKDQGFLKKYDLEPNGSILAGEKHIPIYEEIIQFSDVKYVAGGSAQNTLRGAQYILPKNSTVYVGCVGNDELANYLRSVAEKEGLRTEYLVDTSEPTGVCAVILDGVNRSLVTRLAAAKNYNISHLKSPKIWSLVENADFYYIEGYHFSVCSLCISAICEEAAIKNKVFIINLSAEYLCYSYKTLMDSVSQYWDYVISNESEAIAYADSHDIQTTNIAKIAKYISELPKKNNKRPRVVIITQGDKDIVVAESYNGQTKVTYFSVPKVPDDEILDTNAVGDAFAGGFIASLILGYSLERNVQCGIWLAQLCIKQNGATFPFPKQIFSEQ